MRAIKAILARNLIKFFRDKMRFFFTLFMGGFLLFTFSFVMKSAVAGLAQPTSCAPRWSAQASGRGLHRSRFRLRNRKHRRQSRRQVFR
jgi:hypothetical protein